MPLVNFTPRVGVSRMCTPSRMRLAASVRRISAKASAGAEDRTRVPLVKLL